MVIVGARKLLQSVVVATLGAVVVALGSAHAAPRPAYGLANRCWALQASATGRYVALARSGYGAGGRQPAAAIPLYLKPTGLGTYMLYDRRAGLMAEQADALTRATTPGPAAQWRISQTPAGTFTLISTADGRQLATGEARALELVRPGTAGPGGRLRFVADRRCRPFPEAQIGAMGPARPSVNRDGKVFGWSDLEFHLTASFRAGGEVIAGEDFDPFGITTALSAARDQQEHGPDGRLDVTGNILRFGTPTGRTNIHGWPTFVGWPTYDTLTNQQAYWVWLERAWRSGLRLVMANVSEDQELCTLEPKRSHTCNEEGSIELQVRNLKQLQRYIDAQSGGPGRGFFRIVYTPAQARRVISHGRLAVVIGVESSNPFGCTEHDGKPQCNRHQIAQGLSRWWTLGIRGFFPVHWDDNAFAGAALEGGGTGTFLNLLNIHQTGQPFKTGPCPLPGQGVEMNTTPGPTPSKRRVCNVRGLTSLGAYLIRQMIARHFMILVDHMSEWARERVLSIAAQAHYPLISPHTDTGGTWVAQDLRRLYAGGGVATATLNDAQGNIKRILQLAQFRRPGHYFGVGFGTDTGGFGTLPAPDSSERPLPYPFTGYNGVRFVRERTGRKLFDFNRDGVAQYGLMADAIGEMQRQPHSHSAMSWLFRSAEAYLEAWQRAMRN